MISVQKINDPVFPWAVLENDQIIGRFVEKETAERMRNFFDDTAVLPPENMI